MASIKVKFRPSVLVNKEGTIYYQSIHRRVCRQMTTRYHLFSHEWDFRHSKICVNKRSERDTYLVAICKMIRDDLEYLHKIIQTMNNKCADYTVDDIIEEFDSHAKNASLVSFMEGLISTHRENGKMRTAETYRATLNSFMRFLKVRNSEKMVEGLLDIRLDCINSRIMEEYEAWHCMQGHVPNTVSFYMRILRAVYNRAVELGHTENRKPFRRVYTGIDKTVKRALPLAIIKKIMSLDLSAMPELDYARDMFIMSFMLRGMSFIDMVYLKKSDLKNGSLSYRRRKTGQHLIIGWTDQMQRILNKYPENPTQYLLPIVIKNGCNERSVYKNKGDKINCNLKLIGIMVGSPIPLTLYVARHSWASVARDKGFPLSVISQGLGHDNELTTQIYLSSLETSIVDRANEVIIGSLCD